MLINLTNFGDLFGFAAAMNIAFVAADYFQSYAYILSKKVFKFQDKVTEELEQLKKALIDKTSIDGLRDVNIDGDSTSVLAEKLKDDHEKITKKIDKEKEELINEVNTLCESKTNAFISLLLSLYSVTALLLIGFNSMCEILIKDFWITFTCFCTIIVVFAWISKTPDKNKVVKFCSLKHCLTLFVILILVSILVSTPLFFYVHIPSIVSDCLYIYSEIFVLSNFAAYIFIISRKSRIINQLIEEKVQPLKSECDKINTSASDLMSVIKISNGLKNSKKE